MDIPEKMKVVRQDAAGGKLYTETIPVPRPGKGEVLIKVAASPINPSDLSFINGTYLVQKDYPVVPGLEGSGLVVEAGKGLMPRLRKAKRVMFSTSGKHDGAWAEYVVTSAMTAIPVSAGITFEQAATGIVNPMTALALITMARQGNYKAIINNAAASALGKMLLRLADKEGINMIQIVRNTEQKQTLETMGAKYVLNSREDDFEQSLHQLALKLEAKLVLDAVGGEQTAILTRSTPKGSHIILYAKLSDQDFSLDPRILIKDDKTMAGFQLAHWTDKRKIWQLLADISKVKRLLKSSLKSDIRDTFPLEEVNEAMDAYSRNMSAGKLLLVNKWY